MTYIIVDTNIVFSAFINTDSKIGQLLLNGSRYFTFIAPEYLRTEIIEHQDKLKEIGKLDKDKRK
jgi:predicted nucleic acid-binding protein